jgi:hypothetical protein
MSKTICCKDETHARFYAMLFDRQSKGKIKVSADDMLKHLMDYREAKT